LLSNKAPNIPITTSINISKRGLGALKKGEEKKRRRRRKKEDKCPNIREVLSSLSSPQILESQERYKFLQGAKVELGVHHYHFFTPSFLLTIIAICHYHHISTQPIYLGPHTCTS
jgi:hypothetical protein